MTDLPTPIDELAGKLIRLRALEPNDVEALRHRDTDGARRSGWTSLPMSSYAQRKWWEEDLAKRPDGDQCSLVIETLDGTVVGSMNVGEAQRRTGVFSYGIGLGHAHRRRGYGTEAVVLLLRFYFAELGYQKCDTVVYAFNEESLAFHGQLGFQVEGRRRRHVYTQGRLHDAVLIGMTREEFDEKHGLRTISPPA